MKYIELNQEQLKELHKVQVEILDEIVRICDKHNLQYFLMGGTLLGAVRHKGFIPWDDDLDISMFRKDYDKFIEIAQKELSDNYFLDHYTTNKKYWLGFAKVRKKNTLFSEKSLENIDVNKGIYVDIFPMDNIKKGHGIIEKLRAITIKNITDTFFCKMKISDLKNCRHPLMVKVLSFFSYNMLHKIQDTLCKRYNNLDTKYIVDFTGPSNYNEVLHPVDYYLPLKELEFEGKMYKVPNDSDKYLTKVYGDYMKLPKKEDRVNHSVVELSFDLEKDKKV